MSGFNAQRFEGKPLRQPTYNFRDVPHCSKNLRGSSVQEITERDQLKDAMAEMVLLCKEATRRLSHDRLNGKKSSKPLSLEYIADRLDVDDPVFGYFVRTDSPPEESVSDRWKQGMLQGFISVTTFTNWQKTFRWDSLHDNAFSYDHEELASEMKEGIRRFDEDGSLAEALQSTVRCGDPWNEGIVWPRIAEVSLLGGLGCGKALLSLVIEKLECMKASGNQNYDYLVLQATDNSIPFYESMGFTRVGAITEDQNFEDKQAASSSSSTSSDDEIPEAVPVEDSDASTPKEDASPSPSEIVSSPVTTYVTESAGECPVDIAKKFNVDVWDIIFLNQYIYNDIVPRSRLLKGTSLFIPSEAAKAEATSHATRSQFIDGNPAAPQWYIASENDTPKRIAGMFRVSCSELVQANKERLPQLYPLAKLKEGTRIRVSHFHIHDDKHVPYCHWTFPDDAFESNEPSYMMVRKLNRRKGQAAKLRPVEQALATPISPYVSPPPSMFVAAQAPSHPYITIPSKPSKRSGRHPDEPVPPKRPLSGYFIFCGEHREALKETLAGNPASEYTKVLSKMWSDLPEKEKARYQAKHDRSKAIYREAMAKYEEDLAVFHQTHPELKSQVNGETKPPNLFNKVVKMNAYGLAHAGSEFQYYFVLTYIPDLQWCHLAPMRKAGTFGPDKPKAEGRTIWMLVDESEGKEVDISSNFCVAVKARSMKRTADADREQWDILDEEVDEIPEQCPVRKVIQKKMFKESSVSASTEVSTSEPVFATLGNHGRVIMARSAATPRAPGLEIKRKAGRSKSAGASKDTKRYVVAESLSESSSTHLSRQAAVRAKETIHYLEGDSSPAVPVRRARSATKPLSGPPVVKRKRDSSPEESAELPRPKKRGRPPRRGADASCMATDAPMVRRGRGRPPKREKQLAPHAAAMTVAAALSLSREKKRGRGRPPRQAATASNEVMHMPKGVSPSHGSDSGIPTPVHLPVVRKRGRPPRQAATLSNEAIRRPVGVSSSHVIGLHSEIPLPAAKEQGRRRPPPQESVASNCGIQCYQGVSSAHTSNLHFDAPIPVAKKRGRGRPPKQAGTRSNGLEMLSSSSTTTGVNPDPSIHAPKKRGRGRSSRQEATVPNKLIQSHEEQPPSQTSGMQSGVANPVVPKKRGRGRPPRKASLTSEEAIQDDTREPKTKRSSLGAAENSASKEILVTLPAQTKRERPTRQAAIKASEAIRSLDADADSVATTESAQLLNWSRGSGKSAIQLPCGSCRERHFRKAAPVFARDL